MGWVFHESIIVTSFQKEKIVDAREQLVKIGLPLTGLFELDINGYWTFFVLPCGSKAGWPEQKDHSAKILKAGKVLESFAYEDGSNSIEYAQVKYGNDLESGMESITTNKKPLQGE